VTALGEPAPPFQRIGVVGLGLIGGSIALAARAAWPQIHLVGLDQGALAAAAARRGVVHDAAQDLRDLTSCDLIVLAAPLAAGLEIMPALAALGSDAVVTDVASTKRQVMAAAAAVKLPRFVGGHPMAGSERAGLEHARAELFARRPWLLVDSGSDASVCARVEQFVRGLGAVPLRTNAEKHDSTRAYVSHLPQLVAVALMNAAADAVGEDGILAAGPAFADMTRLASSAPDLWQGILAPNADFIADALARFVASLPSGDDLERDEWVRTAFARAGATRARTHGQKTNG
jgi:prephenate dehydrogenase